VPLPYTYGSDTTLTFSGTVFNSFVRLVKRAQRTGRLRLLYDTPAVRLEWDKESGRVGAVVIRDARSGAERRMPCRAVVLAAGAVNTARLLLESRSESFPEGLGNTHGVLGRYLHDHPLGKIIVDLESPLAVHPPAYVTRLPLERADPLYAVGAVQWTGMGLLARSLLQGRPGRLPWVGFNLFGTMAPSPDNRVQLDRSRRGKNGSSVLELRIRHPAESKRLLEGARDQLVGLLDRAGLRPKVRLWFIEPAGASVHYAGTCRMHASPELGMLDRWSRLHAVPNVAVADSAAFTTGPEKNPCLTAMALSARASDRLAHDLEAGTI
jgi:choline dehydrogenase-like flavoprotein